MPSLFYDLNHNSKVQMKADEFYIFDFQCITKL